MGELIDRSASFWRSHLGALFKLSLGFQVAQYVTLKAWVFAMSAWFPLMLGGQKMAAAAKDDPTEVLWQVGLGTASLLGTMPVYLVIAWFAGVAVTRYTMPALLGRPFSVGEALSRTRSRAGATAGGFLLSLVWFCGLALLLLLPGAALVGGGLYLASGGHLAASTAALLFGMLAAGLGLFAALTWYLLRFLLTMQVLAMEELGAVAALRRSGELVSGRIATGIGGLVKVRATILITVVAIILTAVGIISGLPALVVQFVYGKLLDPVNASPESIPQALLIPAELLQVAAQAAVGPLFAVFGVLFYLDMRMRREGLDLE
ncbi:MAG: hypothetical protein ACYC8T_29185, partial [Myxococcaceae bacterium]